MIKVSVMYPSGAAIRFDMAYYLAHHIPLVQERLGPSLKKVEVEQGIAGAQPASAPTYVAMGHLWFDSVQAFQAGLAQHGTEILSDIPNYTNAQPAIQVSEVKL